MSGEAPRPVAVLGVVAVGTFMSALGGSLINVAVPMIRRDLSADVGEASWILAAYSLTVSALLLVAGRLGDLIGKRPVYAAGFLVFGAGSALCAVSPTLGALVGARAIQGVGAAMLMSTGPALTTAAFPPAQRGRALGLQATATYTGLTVGPSIGGYLAGRYGWHTAFMVNVPIAVLGAVLARTVLPPGQRAPGAAFPWAGAALFGPAIAAILIALTRGQSWGWSSPRILESAALGLVLAVAFVVAERRSGHPLLPIAQIRAPAMFGGLVAAFLQYLVAYMLLFLLPFFLQGPKGLSPARAGTLMTIQPAVMAAVTAMSGWLSDRVGTRWPAVVGMILLGAGVFQVSGLDASSQTSSLLLALGITGLGSGLFTSPNNSSIMGLAPRGQQGITAGLLAEARNLGMLTGVAISGSLFAILGGGRPGETSLGAFLPAFRGTLLVAAALAVVGALVSAIRPRAAPRAP